MAMVHGAADISDILQRELEHVVKGVAAAMRADYHAAQNRAAERDAERLAKSVRVAR